MRDDVVLALLDAMRETFNVYWPLPPSYVPFEEWPIQLQQVVKRHAERITGVVILGEHTPAKRGE